jgi:hypothetical protein
VRVIEQLIQFFWSAGELSENEVQTLHKQGFVHYLPGVIEPPQEWVDEPSDEAWGWGRYDHWDPRDDLPEDVPVRRAPGKRRRKDRSKVTGHNLAPLCALLAGHFAVRKPFPALVELGNRLGPCAAWQQAAAVVGRAEAPRLEAALVGLLNVRPRALGELWFWFHLEPLAGWAAQTANKGPVAAALARLLQTATPSQVGRIGQLFKAAEVRDLVALLAARRRFLAALPGLYGRHFARLGQWLVPPAHAAAGCWPALPWAFVLLYNARQSCPGRVPCGYPVWWGSLAEALRPLAWATAYGMDPERVRTLIDPRYAGLPVNPAEAAVKVRSDGLLCPLTWRLSDAASPRT